MLCNDDYTEKGSEKSQYFFGFCLKWENHPLPSNTRSGTVSVYKCGPEATLADLTKCHFVEGAAKPCYEGLVKQEKAAPCLRAASWNVHMLPGTKASHSGGWIRLEPGSPSAWSIWQRNSSFSRNTLEPCLVCSDVLTLGGSVLVPCPECSLMKQVQVCALAGSLSHGVGKAWGQLRALTPQGSSSTLTCISSFHLRNRWAGAAWTPDFS